MSDSRLSCAQTRPATPDQKRPERLRRYGRFLSDIDEHAGCEGVVQRVGQRGRVGEGLACRPGSHRPQTERRGGAAPVGTCWAASTPPAASLIRRWARSACLFCPGRESAVISNSRSRGRSTSTLGHSSRGRSTRSLSPIRRGGARWARRWSSESRRICSKRTSRCLHRS
jgi:hypothetical protein